MRYEVRTPENVAFTFDVAGVSARALAWFVDFGVMAILLVAFGFVLAISAVALGGLAMALLFIVAFLVQWWYQALFEYFWQGQTPGKRMVGLRVISQDGLRISFAQAAIRNLVRIVDLLPALYLTAVVAAFFDRYGRRLGDLAAGTIVVRERRAPQPSQVIPKQERYNSFVADAEVKHAVRRITPPERDAMVSLGLRRESLPVGVRKELFERMARHLEERLSVRKPSFFSDEKFVLNLAVVALSQSEERPARTSLVPGS